MFDCIHRKAKPAGLAPSLSHAALRHALSSLLYAPQTGPPSGSTTKKFYTLRAVHQPLTRCFLLVCIRFQTRKILVISVSIADPNSVGLSVYMHTYFYNKFSHARAQGARRIFVVYQGPDEAPHARHVAGSPSVTLTEFFCFLYSETSRLATPC